MPEIDLPNDICLEPTLNTMTKDQLISLINRIVLEYPSIEKVN